MDKIMIDEINNDILKLIKYAKNNKWDYYSITDLQTLYTLCGTIDYFDYPKCEIDQKQILLENLKDILSYCKAIYKNINYCKKIIRNTYNDFDLTKSYDPLNTKLPSTILLEESLEITYEFLEKYNNDYLECLDKVKSNNRLFLVDYNDKNDDTNVVGETFKSYNFFEPYMYFVYYKDLKTPLTIAHETTHAYYAYKYTDKLKNRKNISKAIDEIPSSLTELNFLDYLITENIYPEDAILLKKEFDYFLRINMDDIVQIINNNGLSFINLVKNCEEYNYMLNYIFGQYFAYYLYSLKDIEKEFYLIDKILDANPKDDLIKVLKKENITLQSIFKDKDLKSNIRKYW